MVIASQDAFNTKNNLVYKCKWCHRNWVSVTIIRTPCADIFDGESEILCQEVDKSELYYYCLGNRQYDTGGGESVGIDN